MKLPEGRPFRVLAVDDEEDIRESIKQLLELSLERVEVITANDGKRALEILESGEFDLILTDYKMPNMDGLEFLQKAMVTHPNVPRLMLTAYPDPILAARAVKEAGVGLFIAKPFDMDYLVDVVKSLLREGHAQASSSDAATGGPAE